MLDEYYGVRVDRISPEAPIPVMLTTTTRPHATLAGGAANVAAILSQLGATPLLFGFCDLNTGDTFQTCGTILVNQLPVKRRYYQGPHALARLDIEQDNYGQHDLTQQRQQALELFKAHDLPLVILSDYGKGFFGNDPGPWLCGRVSIVDPKRGPINKWRGCTVIKPNAKEAAELSGQTDWRRQLDYFAKETGAEAVVITQGGAGVVAKVRGEYLEHRPAHTIEAVNVVGAGDCFSAAFALCVAQSKGYSEAIATAFEAGQRYVTTARYSPSR